MESRVNYTAVGVFVLLLTLSLIGFAFWLANNGENESDYNYYHIYFDESVSGLSPEGSVQFQGVKVGKVTKIGINPRNTAQVEVTIRILKTTPIKTDTRATLKTIGITGIAYIALSGGKNGLPPIQTSKENYGIIPSAPSLTQRLDETINLIGARLESITEKTDKLFTDENFDNIAHSLANLRSITAQIDSYQSDIQALIHQTSHMETNLTHTSDSLNHVVQNDLVLTLKSLQDSSQEAHLLIRKIETSVERGDYDVRAIITPTMKELTHTLRQTQTLSQEMEQTLQALRESPSDLLFKKSTPKPGPGE